MAEAMRVAEKPHLSPEYLAEMENLVTEDDTPVDNIFSEKQQRLLTDPLYSSWQPGRPFVAFANVGLFYEIKAPPLVPDMLLSLDVTPPEEVWQKRHRSYFVWEYGKPPEVVIEVVSNKIGGEAGNKLQKYAEIGVDWYVIYDPERRLSKTPLRIYKKTPAGYLETVERFIPALGLGLKIWQGVYQDLEAAWLRWCDADNRLIATGGEGKAAAEQRAAEAEQRAAEAEQCAAEAQHLLEQERRRAEAERRQLAAKLRALGIDPDTP